MYNVITSLVIQSKDYIELTLSCMQVNGVTVANEHGGSGKVLKLAYMSKESVQY